ncbi:MAG: PaaI family thioesterase [Blastocatellia bacterium]|nr:PaaI family thioesterase [Blastocatellia bacterium]
MDKQQLLQSVADNQLLRFLGVEIVEASGERVVLTMEVTPKVHQYTGVMNGGVSMYLVETAASIGVVAGSDLAKVTPVGIEINGNHLRAVSKGTVTVIAKPIYPGRTMSVWGVEITDSRGKLVCTSRITLLNQKRPATLA